MSTTGSPSGGPASAMRNRTPDGRSMNRCAMSRLCAGKSSSERSGRFIARTTTGRLVQRGSDCLDGSPSESSDQTETEGDVRPALVSGTMILEGVHRPQKGIRAFRRGHSLVRMPDAVGIAILEKAIEQLAPVLVPLEEAKPRHQLQPRDRHDDVFVRGIAMRQVVAEDEMWLRDDGFSAQLKRFL